MAWRPIYFAPVKDNNVRVMPVKFSTIARSWQELALVTKIFVQEYLELINRLTKLQISSLDYLDM